MEGRGLCTCMLVGESYAPMILNLLEGPSFRTGGETVLRQTPPQEPRARKREAWEFL